MALIPQIVSMAILKLSNPKNESKNKGVAGCPIFKLSV
jgi:hypothetical protein